MRRTPYEKPAYGNGFSKGRVQIGFCQGDFFPPVWPTVHTFPVKTVTENTSFQKHLKNPPECSEGF